MFLTKKQAPNNKPKPKNSKALGGWEDDDQHKPTSKSQSTHPSNPLTHHKPSTFDLLGDDQQLTDNLANVKIQDKEDPRLSSNQTGTTADRLYTRHQLSSMKNIDLETKLVGDVVAPSGIRLKQSDSQLSEFLNEAKNMQIPIISSLLICELYPEQENFQAQLRALHCIEYLIKKNIQYSVYFKLHVDVLQNCPTPAETGDHRGGFDKMRKNVLGALGAVFVKPDDRKYSDGMEFVDPGYAATEDNLLAGMTKPQKNKDKPPKKLISPADVKSKRVLQGPGSKHKPKEEQNSNLLDIGSQKDKEINLLEGPGHKQPANMGDELI